MRGNASAEHFNVVGKKEGGRRPRHLEIVVVRIGQEKKGAPEEAGAEGSRPLSLSIAIGTCESFEGLVGGIVRVIERPIEVRDQQQARRAAGGDRRAGHG